MRPIDLLAKLGGVVHKTVKKLDIFSQKIMLTYKGEASFSTFLGGLVSIIIFLVIGIYGAYLLQIMINRQNSNNSLSTEVIDLSISDENYYPVDYGFSFGIAFANFDGVPLQIDPTVFTIKFTQNTVVNMSGIYQITTQDLGYKLWDVSDFPNLSQQFNARGLNRALYCPANKRYKIAGNYLANNYQYINVGLERWTGSGWKSSAQIDSVLFGATVNVIISNSYMDFSNFDTPIQSFVDDRTSFYMLSSMTKISKIYAKLNKAILDDDYMKLKSATTKQFFSVDRIQTDIASISQSAIAITAIFMDPNRDTYQRTVFSILDLFGTIGGIYGLLCSSWGALIGIISSQILLASVFRRLYFTQKITFEGLAEKVIGKSDKIRNAAAEETKEQEFKRRKFDHLSKRDDARENSEIDVKLENSINSLNEGDFVNKKYVRKFKDELMHRKKYQANCCHKILTLIPSCILRYKGIIKK